MQEKIESINIDILPQVMHYGKVLVTVILILIIGWWIINKLKSGTSKLLEKRDVDVTVRPFLISTVNISMKLLLIVIVISYIGIPMTSLVALLGAAGLAIGMAFSGTLQNVAGGVILLVLKPFKVGDFIEAQGYLGTVQEIQIFNTFILSPDNKAVVIPNGGLATGVIINYSKMDRRRVEVRFSVDYNNDIMAIRTIIDGIVSRNIKILNDPKPLTEVMTLTDSGMEFVCRVWAATSDYWEVYFYMNENVKREFDSKSVKFAHQRREIHLKQ